MKKLCACLLSRLLTACRNEGGVKRHRGESGRSNSSSALPQISCGSPAEQCHLLTPHFCRGGSDFLPHQELWSWTLRHGWSTSMWMWLQALSSSHGFWFSILLRELPQSSLSHTRDAAGLRFCWAVCSPLSWFLSGALGWGFLAPGDHDKGSFIKAFLTAGFQKVLLPSDVSDIYRAVPFQWDLN